MLLIRGLVVMFAFSISCSAFSEQRLCTDEELIPYNLFMDHNQVIVDSKVDSPDPNSNNLVSRECREKMGRSATDRKNDKIICGKTFDFCDGNTKDNLLCDKDIFADDGKTLCGNVRLTINSEECSDYIYKVVKP